MNISNYDIEQINGYSYRFYSIGPKGEIEIRIGLTPIDDNLYNLGFGVWNAERDNIDYEAQTRNGDMDKILATVASVTIRFLRDHSKVYIIATGSSGARTRKYQMGINRHLANLVKDHIVGGFIAAKSVDGGFTGSWPEWDGEWFEFEKGINYDAFLLSLK